MAGQIAAVAPKMRRPTWRYEGERMRELRLRSRLHFVSNALSVPGRSPRVTVAQALAGGVGMVEYMGHGKTTRQMVREAAELVWSCRRLGVPLIVSGRTDVALAALADGVHLEADDMPVVFARRLLGPGAIIGVTCRGLPDAREAQREGASYVAIGPIFASGADPYEPPLGIEAIGIVAAALDIPVCATGGITVDNAPLLADSPARLVSVDAAIAMAEDAAATTRALVEALEGV